MRSRSSFWLLALFALLALCATTSLVGCMESKVAQGQRFVSGNQKYDPYFESIHQQQVAAAAWPDERKVARRPLVSALGLTPDAPDDTIISATRERAKKLGGGGAKLDLAGPRVTAQGGATADGALFGAVEESARAEQERARKLKAASDKFEEMAKHGVELKKEADKEFENRGSDKADEKKTAAMRELRNELGGAVDAMKSLSREATKSIKEGEEFLEDVGGALEMKETPKRSRSTRPVKTPRGASPPQNVQNVEEKKPPEEASKPPEEKRPPAKPAEPAKPKPAPKPPAEKPAEKPAQPQKPPPDEVFNP